MFSCKKRPSRKEEPVSVIKTQLGRQRDHKTHTFFGQLRPAKKTPRFFHSFPLATPPSLPAKPSAVPPETKPLILKTHRLPTAVKKPHVFRPEATDLPETPAKTVEQSGIRSPETEATTTKLACQTTYPRLVRQRDRLDPPSFSSSATA